MSAECTHVEVDTGGWGEEGTCKREDSCGLDALLPPCHGDRDQTGQAQARVQAPLHAKPL